MNRPNLNLVGNNRKATRVSSSNSVGHSIVVVAAVLVVVVHEVHLHRGFLSVKRVLRSRTRGGVCPMELSMAEDKPAV